jgi:hypothetical protein
MPPLPLPLPQQQNNASTPTSKSDTDHRLDTKLVILLSVLGTLFSLLVLFTIYICYRRCLYRALARRIASKNQGFESRALPPRINGRNARFFGPGLVRGGEGDLEMGWDSRDVEMKMLVEEKHKFRGIVMPGKVYGGWRGERG